MLLTRDLVAQLGREENHCYPISRTIIISTFDLAHSIIKFSEIVVR